MRNVGILIFNKWKTEQVANNRAPTKIEIYKKTITCWDRKKLS